MIVNLYIDKMIKIILSGVVIANVLLIIKISISQRKRNLNIPTIKNIRKLLLNDNKRRIYKAK